MNRADVTELHYITTISNVISILQHGILSNTLAAELPHDSVAMPEIQEIRANKQIPGARRLHEYANLYFDAHNAMLSKRRGYNSTICVLQVDSSALDLPGVILTDRNAASSWVSFMTVHEGLAAIDRDRLFARSWKHPEDMYDEMNHKSEKCAEILVPDRVEARFVVGAYVANQNASTAFQALGTGLPVRIRGDMFF
jgi:ssDNA thymidine ADP-ribosyltransferase, DarT